MKKEFYDIIDFIRKLYGSPEKTIPLHAPLFVGNEKNYLQDCIDSTYVSSVGKYVDLFEETMAEYTGAKKAVACVNGTNALHLALKIAGVEPETEIITQALTFVATSNAISYCNANPVFIDVDPDTMGLSSIALKNWLREFTDQRFNNSTKENETVDVVTGRKISACVPMHTFGHPCRIDEIIDICNQYNIPVIEDAAESMGSLYKNRHTGTFGKIGILSFNGNKIITTGGGGMLLFNDDVLAKRAKHLSTQAKLPHPWEFVHDEIGYNYRMPNINAALGVAQMEYMDFFLEKKRKTALLYKEYFEKMNIRFFTEPEFAKSNYWLNVIILDSREDRDDLLRITNGNGIMTRPVWQLMNKLKMFKNCQKDGLKNSLWLEDRVVNIPSSVNILL